MGIKKFFSYFKDSPIYGKNEKVKMMTNQAPAIISCLFFDLNSIFHNAAAYVYGYLDEDDLRRDRVKLREYQEHKAKIDSMTDDELELMHFHRIFQEIYDIIVKVNPQDYVVLAVDGVAPMAKITQQRSRRYKAAKERAGRATKPRFDSNCITPGTDFMFYLDYNLQMFLKQCVQQNKFSVKEIIYSSHLVHGEGEHKIFDLLRKQQVVPDIGANVVYGADADLFMLSLLSETSNIYIFRDSVRPGEQYFININMFKDELIKDMTIYRLVADIPDKIVVQDFVLIFFLIGNDFLPSMLAFENLKDSINRAQKAWRDNGKPLTDDNAQIIWENFRGFINLLAKREKVLLENIAKDEQEYLTFFDALKQATTITINQENIITGSYEEKDETYVASVNMNKLAEGWYNKALSPRHPDAQNLLDKFKVGYLTGDSRRPEYVKEMCMEYFKGMQWVLNYYTKGIKGITNRFIYIYHYAPLLKDLAEVLSEAKFEEMPTVESLSPEAITGEPDLDITPVHQLMMVQPPASWDLIPAKWREFMYRDLKDIGPFNFMIDKEGRHKPRGKNPKIVESRVAAHDIPIISIADPERVVFIANQRNIPHKYDEGKNYFIKVLYNPNNPRAAVRNWKQRLAWEKKEIELKQKQAELNKEARLPSKKTTAAELREQIRELKQQMVEAEQKAIEDILAAGETEPEVKVKDKVPKAGKINMNWSSTYVM
jgi:5'-3' exonuclease